MHKLDLNQQCPSGQLCINYCNKTHYRCFAGICVQEILKSGSCTNSQCQLIHYSKKEYQSELNILPINGIYRYNICRNKLCKQLNDCPFLHPAWAKKYCIDYVMGECNDTTHSNHVYWNDMRIVIYQEFIKKLKITYNPDENSEELKIELGKNSNICVENLSGLCEKKDGQCFQNHIFWENLNQNNFLKTMQIKNCIEEQSDIHLGMGMGSERGLRDVLEYQKYQSLGEEQIKEQLCQNHKLKVQDKNVIDYIFVMDFTEFKAKLIENFLQSLKKIYKIKYPFFSTVRVGVVGYNDGQDKQQPEYHELTNAYEKVIVWIAKQKTKGKEEKAMDICFGIEKAMSQNISKHPNSQLITILLADAPCHGKQYHNNQVRDNLADQVPPNTLENLMKKYYNMKPKNYFACMSLTDKTNLMFEIMKLNFPGLIISQKIESFQEFYKLVMSTLENRCQITQQLNKEEYYQVQFEKPNLLFWDYKNLKIQEKNLFWKHYQDLTKFGETTLIFFDKAIVNVQEELGQNSKVYKFLDVGNNLWVIVKIPKNIVELNQTRQQVSEKDVCSAENQALIRYQNQARAMWLSFIFRKKTLHIQGAPPIFFPLPILYTLKNQTFQGLSKIYGEVYIDIPELKWKKYSNNGIYQDNQHYFYSAFSHFVLEETQRWFTFTDLQGKRNLLSDPAIQTSQNFPDKSINDQQNLREIGIGNYLVQHYQCSFICQKLGLEQRDNKTDLNHKKWLSERKDQKIDIFCEICDNQAEITSEQYQSDNQICQECREKIPDIVYHFCKCCRNYYPSYQRMFNLSRCVECKRCKQGRNQACIYCNITCTYQLKKIEINSKSVFICHQSYSYLKSLSCSVCQSFYDFQVLLDNTEYQKGIYYCRNENCQKFK